LKEDELVQGRNGGDVLEIEKWDERIVIWGRDLEGG
jgi:hypothetical protein